MKQKVNLLRKLDGHRHRAARIIVPEVNCTFSMARPADGKIRLPIVR